MTQNNLLLPFLNEKGKERGIFKLKNCTVRNFYTFLDLYVRNNLKLVPVIAVDYSLANLTFDENGYCLHSLKQGQPNDYLDALRLVYRSFEKFSEFMMTYGFGARTVQGDGPACNVFSMTGDFTEPFIESEEDLVEGYRNTLRNVKLALPVQFRDIIKLVCDLA